MPVRVCLLPTHSLHVAQLLGGSPFADSEAQVPWGFPVLNTGSLLGAPLGVLHLAHPRRGEQATDQMSAGVVGVRLEQVS